MAPSDRGMSVCPPYLRVFRDMATQAGHHQVMRPPEPPTKAFSHTCSPARMLRCAPRVRQSVRESTRLAARWLAAAEKGERRQARPSRRLPAGF